MSDFVEWLRASALTVSTHNAELHRFVENFSKTLIEPPCETCMLDLTEFPQALEHRWDRDRPMILEMIYAWWEKDLSDELTFEMYAAARARRCLMMTEPTEVVRKQLNVIQVPTDEVVAASDWPVMLAACGADEWFSNAAWIARFVRERMTDAWTGYALVELFAAINTVIASEREPPQPGGISLAAAFRHSEDPTHELAMRTGTAELRRQMLMQVFPGSELERIPYGKVLSHQAINIYRDAVCENFRDRLGPPAHRLEAEMRQAVLDEATIAQCVGMDPLPMTLQALLNHPG